MVAYQKNYVICIMQLHNFYRR